MKCYLLRKRFIADRGSRNLHSLARVASQSVISRNWSQTKPLRTSLRTRRRCAAPEVLKDLPSDPRTRNRRDFRGLAFVLSVIRVSAGGAALSTWKTLLNYIRVNCHVAEDPLPSSQAHRLRLERRRFPHETVPEVKRRKKISAFSENESNAIILPSPGRKGEKNNFARFRLLF